MEKLSDKAQASLQKVVDRFRSGDLSPIVDVARIHLGGNCPAAKWTMRNKMLAYAQCQELDCRGFKQWQKVNRKVKKHTHGVWICTPWTFYEKELDPATGKKKVKYVKFYFSCVHPASHTEGEPITDYEATPQDPPPLAALAERLGIEVNYGPLLDAEGWANRNDRILLGTHDPATWFHELAHRIHSRIAGEKKVAGQDPHRETTAELSAAVLMDLYGWDHTGNAWQYISAYNDDPIEAVSRALSEVQAVLEFVFMEDDE